MKVESSTILEKRPDFGPNQVRRSSDIKVGDQLLMWSNFSGQRLVVRQIEVITAPYSKLNSLWIGVEWKLINPAGHVRVIRQELPLGDHSVEPYMHGWNSVNWLERIPPETS